MTWTEYNEYLESDDVWNCPWLGVNTVLTQIPPPNDAFYGGEPCLQEYTPMSSPEQSSSAYSDFSPSSPNSSEQSFFDSPSDLFIPSMDGRPTNMYLSVAQWAVEQGMWLPPPPSPSIDVDMMFASSMLLSPMPLEPVAPVNPSTPPSDTPPARTRKSGKTADRASRSSAHALGGRPGKKFFCECGVGFSREGDLRRHRVSSKAHGTPIVFACGEPECEITFTREDAKRRHLHDQHHKFKVTKV